VNRSRNAIAFIVLIIMLYSVDSFHIIQSNSRSHAPLIISRDSFSLFIQNMGQIKTPNTKYYAYTDDGMITFTNDSVVFYQRFTNNTAILNLDLLKCGPVGIDEITRNIGYFINSNENYTGCKAYRYIIYPLPSSEEVLLFFMSSEGLHHEFLDTANIRAKIQTSNANRDTASANIQQTSLAKDIALFESKLHNFSISESSTNNYLISSSLFGGGNEDIGEDVTVDAYGDIYITGKTESIDFPAYNGIDYDNNGPSDCFVIKMNSTGNGLIFATYIGGSSADGGYTIDVDAFGCVYIGGVTNSPDFPIRNSFDSSYNGDLDCFILKLNASGNEILFSTYLGGTDYDRLAEITLDSNQNIIATGLTSSNDFPLINESNNTYSGNGDCFITQLSFNGTSLLYSGMFGGSEVDTGSDLVIDKNGTIYVTGTTRSSDFPVLNAIDISLSGYSDAFIVVIDEFQALEFSTYYGGNSYESGTSLAFDLEGSVIIAGETKSSDFPLLNPFDDTLDNDEYDGFVAKLNLNDMNLIYSSYIGGSGIDSVESILLDAASNIYIVGTTSSSDFQSSSSFDDTFNGINDGFLMKLSSNGSNLLYSTFIGGSGGDSCSSMSFGDSGSIWVTGSTWSEDFLTANSSFDEYRGGTSDCFLLGIRDTTDSDGDLLPDWWECEYQLNMYYNDSKEDSDDDNLTNLDEFIIGTNPLYNDSDFDWMPDGWEYLYGLDVLKDDSGDDPDDDGLTNYMEYVHNTMPFINDTDSDLIPDGWEVLHGLNPLLNDSYNDPDDDNLSNLNEFYLGTLPLNDDSDFDQMPDGWEYNIGLNPLMQDAYGDPDSDLLSNLLEYNHGTNPFISDTDFDGMSDKWEVELGFDPIDPNFTIYQYLVYNIVGIIFIVTIGFDLLLARYLLLAFNKSDKKKHEALVRKEMHILLEEDR